MTCALKETFDATANSSSALVIRRRRRVLRVFQMGNGRGLGNIRNGRADRFGLVPARRIALTS